MQVTRITLEDVRAIRRMEIDFSLAPAIPRNRTIILGVNGAGKTTILDGVVHAFAMLAEQPHLGAIRLSAPDVRNDEAPTIAHQSKQRRAKVTLDFVLTDDDWRAVRTQYPRGLKMGTVHFRVEKGFDFEAAVEAAIASVNATTKYLNSTSASTIPQLPPLEELPAAPEFEDIARAVVASGETHPICVFLPADRGILDAHPKLTLEQVLEFNSCTNSLSKSRDRFAPLAARLALCGTPPRTDVERAVARMWKVIEKYFPEMPRPIEAHRGMLRFRDRRGAIVPLTSLSDGERAILLIFTDLALRNPQNNVVLIDELEQHLHPRWQRQMLYGLSSLLPNAQFIITTQSPYLAACAPDDVIKLPEWDTHGE